MDFMPGEPVQEQSPEEQRRVLDSLITSQGRKPVAPASSRHAGKDGGGTSGKAKIQNG
jgi:hypothetical protein